MQPATIQPAVRAATPLASAPQTALASTDLFRSCSSADSDRAWREFVHRFHPRLVAAVQRTLLRLDARSGDDDRVEDLVQEIYCRLLAGGRRNLQRFQGETEAELVVYLQRIAASVVVDRRRVALAGKRWGGVRVTYEEWFTVTLRQGVDRESPEERLLARERRREFLLVCRSALGRRSTATTLRIARLALLEGWTSREIAAGLDGQMGVAGIDSVIYRLRRSLAQRGIDLPRRDRRRRG